MPWRERERERDPNCWPRLSQASRLRRTLISLPTPALWDVRYDAAYHEIYRWLRKHERNCNFCRQVQSRNFQLHINLAVWRKLFGRLVDLTVHVASLPEVRADPRVLHSEIDLPLAEWKDVKSRHVGCSSDDLPLTEHKWLDDATHEIPCATWSQVARFRARLQYIQIPDTFSAFPSKLLKLFKNEKLITFSK